MAQQILKILVIDDSVAIQRSLGRLLASIDGVEMAGFAEDVTGARSLIQRTRPDVVVLDVALRDSDKGIEVLDFLQRDRPEVKVLVMSNTASPKLRERYLDAGAVAYFDKASEFMRARDWIETHVLRLRDRAPHGGR